MKKSVFPKYKLFRLILLLIFITAPVESIAEEVKIICNNNVPESSLSKNEIRSIYLGEKNTWSNDKKIVFVILAGEADVDRIHNEFLSAKNKKNLLGRKIDQPNTAIANAKEDFKRIEMLSVLFTQKGLPKSFADKKYIEIEDKVEGIMNKW